MKNYEYKFVEVPTSENGKEANAPLKICAQNITAESKGGWRLKQIMEPQANVRNANSYLIILEKEVG